MKYCAGYKYQLVEDEVFDTEIVGYSFKTPFYELTLIGKMKVKAGYAWNGADCFPDIPSVMRGSLAHDCGYQMIHERYLPLSERPFVDGLLFDCCIEDGMPELIARTVFEAVENFGEIYCDFTKKREILIAPEVAKDVEAVHYVNDLKMNGKR